MSKVWLSICAALLLGACGSQSLKPGATFDRIGQEVAEAAASRPKPKIIPEDTVGQAMMPPLQLDMPTAPAAEPRFNLAVNNAPASQVFMALVSGTRFSIVFAPDLAGSISLNLKNVTVREALDTIRDLYGYEYRIQGSRIMIQSNTMQSRIFQINYLASRRQGTSDLSVASSGSSLQGSSGAYGNSPVTTAAQAAVAQPVGATGQTLAGGSTTSAGSAASRVHTTSEVDFWKTLETALNAIVGGSGGGDAGGGPKIIVNTVSGIVVVRAMPREMRLVENYLRATQTVVERQVMLEAKILEVSLSESYQAGINWAAFTSGPNSHLAAGVTSPNSSLQPATRGAGGRTTAKTLAGDAASALPGLAGSVVTSLGQGFVGLAFQTSNFAALISFLESQGNVQVLSSPRIATLNNQKAVLKVGNDSVYITGFTVSASTVSSATTTTTSAVPTPTTSTLFSGISLDVMPQIDDDGNIVLHVHPAVSQVSETNKVFNLGTAGQVSLPLASRNVNETDSIVRVRDGNIVAIGGLMSQDQSMDRSGLPGTTSSPLGLLLGQRSSSMNKRELVILLKPTIIASGENSGVRDLEETRDRLNHFDPRQQTRQDTP